MIVGIKIRDKSFSISLYDKQNDFPFSIVRMSYLCSNIPTKIFYSVFGAAILRIARTTSTCNEFRTSSEALLNIIQNQGGNTVGLEKTLSI